MAEASLRDKVVLITGASRRIGRALAIASAQAGADVIIHYRTSAALAEAGRLEIEALGRNAWILQADLSKPQEVASLAEKAFRLAPVFGLVNNAALFSGGPFGETSLADWETQMAVNLTAPFLLTQAFARLVGTQRKGRVVNLLDWRASRPGADHFAYTVTKAALAAMTHSLAQSMAPNISVNGLALGAFLPPPDRERDPEIVRRTPAGRWGELHEAGHALVFLLGGPAYVTGEIVHVDGGRHLL
ncbi:MAG: SDR family oxidoreductase [Chloroflexota bacterium]